MDRKTRTNQKKSAVDFFSIFLKITVDNYRIAIYHSRPITALCFLNHILQLLISVYSSLVQSVERWTVNPYVAGSSPAGGANFLLISFYLSPFVKALVIKSFSPNLLGLLFFLRSAQL